MYCNNRIFINISTVTPTSSSTFNQLRHAASSVASAVPGPSLPPRWLRRRSRGPARDRPGLQDPMELRVRTILRPKMVVSWDFIGFYGIYEHLGQLLFRTDSNPCSIYGSYLRHFCQRKQELVFRGL